MNILFINFNENLKKFNLEKNLCCILMKKKLNKTCGLNENFNFDYEPIKENVSNVIEKIITNINRGYYSLDYFEEII
jgi:hypothetical protein